MRHINTYNVNIRQNSQLGLIRRSQSTVSLTEFSVEFTPFPVTFKVLGSCHICDHDVEIKYQPQNKK